MSTDAVRAPSPLSRVELRHLAAIAAIAREGSFRGAAESLGYVQSAVSQQLADLERLVGMRLVDRSRGSTPVSLTPAGYRLLEHAEEILAYFEAARADLDALSEGRAGKLRIGTFQSVASFMLPRITARFATACPGFGVEQTLADNDIPLLAMLEAGELDLAFGELHCPEHPFESVELMDDPMVLLVSTRSPLAQGGPPSLSEIGDLPLIGFHSESRVHTLVVDALARHDVELSFTYRVDLNTTLQALVAADLGVAVVPYLTVDPSHEGTVVIELPELPRRQILLLWHRDRERSAAAAQFTEIAQAVSPKFRMPLVASSPPVELL